MYVHTYIRAPKSSDVPARLLWSSSACDASVLHFSFLLHAFSFLQKWAWFKSQIRMTGQSTWVPNWDPLYAKSKFAIYAPRMYSVRGHLLISSARQRHLRLYRLPLPGSRSHSRDNLNYPASLSSSTPGSFFIFRPVNVGHLPPCIITNGSTTPLQVPRVHKSYTYIHYGKPGRKTVLQWYSVFLHERTRHASNGVKTQPPNPKPSSLLTQCMLGTNASRRSMYVIINQSVGNASLLYQKTPLTHP